MVHTVCSMYISKQQGNGSEHIKQNLLSCVISLGVDRGT